MKDLGRLKDLVIEKIDLAEVMLAYGVKFIYDPRRAAEAQYHCPFHGKDNKPSSRFYRATSSCWCWKCHKKWDVIEFVRDKESLSYTGAILHIIDRWRVDTSEIPDTPVLDLPVPQKADNSSVELLRLRGLLREKRGRIPYEKYAAMFTAWQMIAWDKHKGKPVDAILPKLEQKLETI